MFEYEIDDVASLYSLDSRATSTDFSFDDVIINSQAYRRALLHPTDRTNPALMQGIPNSESKQATGVQIYKHFEPPRSHESTQSAEEHLEMKAIKLEKELLSLESEYREKEMALVKVGAEKNRLEDDWKRLSIKLQSLDKENGALQKEVQVQDEELSSLRSGIDVLAAEMKAMNQAKAFLEEENERRGMFYREAETERKALMATYSAANDLMTSKLEKLEIDNTELNKAIEDLKPANARLLKDRKVVVERLKRCETDVGRLQAEVTRWRYESQECEKKLGRSQSLVAQLQASVQHYKRFDCELFLPTPHSS